jgi:hypothetical protein
MRSWRPGSAGRKRPCASCAFGGESLRLGTAGAGSTGSRFSRADLVAFVPDVWPLTQENPGVAFWAQGFPESVRERRHDLKGVTGATGSALRPRRLTGSQ